MASSRTRDSKGRFQKTEAAEALENLQTAISLGGLDDDKENIKTVADALDNAEIELDDLKARMEEIQKLDSVNSYLKGRKQDRALEEEQDLVKQLQKELKEYKALEKIDLFADNDPEIDIKVAQPENFDGRGENVDVFLTASELVFKTSTKKYATARAKVLYVLSYCTKGQAEQWREKVMKDFPQFLQDVAEVAQEKEIGGWEAFKEMFSRLWKGTNTLLEAQAKLQNVRQGNMSVEEYLTTFRLIAGEAHVGEGAELIFFKKGLKEVIKRRIYDSGNVPKDLKEWVDRARIIDAAYRESELDRRGTSWRSPPGKIRYTDEKRPRLPDEVYQKRRKEGLCYKCGNKGHMAKECFAKGRRIQEEPKDIQPEGSNGSEGKERDFA